MKDKNRMLLALVAFIAGYMLSSSNNAGPVPMMEKYATWSPQEQGDFITAAIQHNTELRREIAEDWCAINPETRRVCWRAKLLKPVMEVRNESD